MLPDRGGNKPPPARVSISRVGSASAGLCGGAAPATAGPARARPSRIGSRRAAGTSETWPLCPLDAGPQAGRSRPEAGGGGRLSSSPPSAASIAISRSHHHNHLSVCEYPPELIDLAGRWSHATWFFRGWEIRDFLCLAAGQRVKTPLPARVGHSGNTPQKSWRRASNPHHYQAPA
jgi:hypothetical protein